MPAKEPLTSVECYSLSHLNDELASIQEALSCAETEETWDSIADAVSRFAAICQGNANTYPTDLVSALRASSRPICSALNSERTRLSGTTTDFLSTAITALGSAFEPLIPQYLPTLFTLCTRTNKVFVNRAKTCIAIVVENTQAPAIIHHCAVSIADKSVSLRLAAAETLMLCMKTFNPPDLERENRAKEIEACIRSTAVDPNADIRKVGRKIFEAYKILLPGRVQSFTDPMSPRTRKYLDVKGTALPHPQPSSRPTSSQSVRSTSSDTRSVTAAKSSNPSSSTTAIAGQRPVKHVRSASSSQAVTQAAPPKRPMRAPTPEVAPPEGPRGVRTREEPRRLKVNMPPPDYIPMRADAGPQRPMSATELHFISSHAHVLHSDKPTTGPQRVMRIDPTQAGICSTTQAVRTGPIRPALFNVKSSEPDDRTSGEKKERVVGGARRVLRMPEPDAPGPSTEGKEKATATSGPIRSRVISTSKSTPPVLSAAPTKDDATRTNKLASSVGASSRTRANAGPSGAPTPVTTSRITTTSNAYATQTATSRSRAVEKQVGRKSDQEKTKLKEREMEREKLQPKPLSKAAVSRPAPTVTMRDRTNRSSKSAAETDRPTRKESRKVSAKARASPEIPEVAETVSPAEVPLPESPKPAPAPQPASIPPVPLLVDASVQDITLVPEHIHAPTSTTQAVDAEAEAVVPSPTVVPLPPSRPPSDGHLTPPPIAVSPPDAPEPRTPTPEHRSRGPTAEVAQTPISALVASIQRGFLAMHTGTPLSPMREEEESMLVVEEVDEMVLGVEELSSVSKPARVQPLFSRTGALHA